MPLPGRRKKRNGCFGMQSRRTRIFVFAAVKGDYGERVYPFFTYAVRIDAPKDVRMQRVKSRSFQKFGKRMQRGGDLHEAEERFFAFAASRSETLVEDWLESLNCPVLRVDGTKAIAQNVDFIVGQIQERVGIHLGQEADG